MAAAFLKVTILLMVTVYSIIGAIFGLFYWTYLGSGYAEWGVGMLLGSIVMGGGAFLSWRHSTFGGLLIILGAALASASFGGAPPVTCSGSACETRPPQEFLAFVIFFGGVPIAVGLFFVAGGLWRPASALAAPCRIGRQPPKLLPLGVIAVVAAFYRAVAEGKRAMPTRAGAPRSA